MQVLFREYFYYIDAQGFQFHTIADLITLTLLGFHYALITVKNTFYHFPDQLVGGIGPDVITLFDCTKVFNFDNLLLYFNFICIKSLILIKFHK